jgi:F-type H+-transporting ATPase subunit epsilon
VAEEVSSGTLQVTVVSPARPIFDGEAKFVTAPAWDLVGGSRSLYGPDSEGKLSVGQLGILPHHAPLVAALGSGLLRIGLTSGGVDRYAVSGGFLKVGDNRVTILVDRAMTETDVDAGEAQRELEETVAELQHPKSEDEFAELLDQRTWAEARINLAKK